MAKERWAQWASGSGSAGGSVAQYRTNIRYLLQRRKAPPRGADARPRRAFTEAGKMPRCRRPPGGHFQRIRTTHARMPPIAFDRFHRYAELTTILQAFAAEHPELVAIESIGKSYEGRDIWVLTLTRRATGDAADKPALWVDGNIHATEVAGSAACLYFVHTLVAQYGKDPDITRGLDTRAFYVCPRINPDGAEWALADKPKWIRSSTRPYPHDEDELEGLTVEDVDGDGRILQMRIADSNGLWKAHPEAPQLMVRRDPVETGGAYYRILPEGTFDGWDGFTLRVKRRKEGLDL